MSKQYNECSNVLKNNHSTLQEADKEHVPKMSLSKGLASDREGQH